MVLDNLFLVSCCTSTRNRHDSYVWPHDADANVRYLIMEPTDSVPRHHSIEFVVWMREVGVNVRCLSMESAVVAVSRQCWHLA
jgi:hypothetical protein